MTRSSVAIYLSCYDHEMTGLGTYAAEIVPKVIQALQDEGLDAILYLPSDTELPLSSAAKVSIQYLPKVVRKSVSGSFAPFVRLFVDLWFARKVNRSQLVYTPFSFAPLFSKNRIITIHDAICFHFPLQKPIQTLYFSLILRSLAKKSRKIITISETTRSDLLKWFKLDQEKIQVVYNGLKRRNVSLENGEACSLAVEFSSNKFFLALGTTYRHKNMEVVFEACRLMHSSAPIVIVGPKSEYLNSLLKKYSDLVSTGRVVDFGFVSEAQLLTAFRKCIAVIVPSKYEGFSLPVGEALLEGAKVLASDIPVHREIYSRYVRFFDADSAIDLAANLDSIETALFQLSDLSDLQGKCSWERAAGEISEAILRALQS